MQALEYVRLSRGLNINELVPANPTEIIAKIKKNPAQDHYISLYKYNDKHFEEFKKTHSVKGIVDVQTDRLLWDFDSALSLESAQKDAKELCSRLIESGVPEGKIRPSFSGNKGFHVEVLLNDALNRQEFVNVTFNLAHGLPTFDVRINDEARVIRAPFTKHQESNLYKIPLTVEQLNTYSIADIKVNAADISKIAVRPYFEDTNWKIDTPEPISILKTQTYKKVASLVTTEIKGFDTKGIDFTLCPRWMVKERYALQEGFFYGSESVNLGERNIAFMILAATYRNQGFSEDHALALLTATAEKQALRTNEEIVTPDRLQREVISSVYSPNWKGGIYGKDEPLLVLTRERFNLNEESIDTEIENIINVGDGFKSFAKNMQKNRILVGLKSLDEKLLLTTGMLCTVVSAPGGGKTALSNLFAETVSKENENVLYFSLDLYKNLLFGRMLQRNISYDIKTILQQFENDSVDDNLMNAYTQVLENYTNVGFSFKMSSIDDIEKEIQLNIKLKGKSPKLVIVDYLDKVKSPYTDPTQSSAYVAGRLSDIAKKYETLVLLLAQPSKFGSSGPEQEFTSYRSLKGSSSIESDSRVVLGIHRPGYSASDDINDKYTSITILKNNTGSLGRLDYSWNGLAGTFNELNFEQRRELKQLRTKIESEKDGQSRGY